MLTQSAMNMSKKCLIILYHCQSTEKQQQQSIYQTSFVLDLTLFGTAYNGTANDGEILDNDSDSSDSLVLFIALNFIVLTTTLSQGGEELFFVVS